jgi:O-antigen/teichoic acid export membrane protein
MLGLFAVHFQWFTSVQFVFLLIAIYGVATLLMMLSAFWVRKPVAQIFIPKEFRAIFIYSAFIILSGSVAAMLIDIDRFMISQFVKIENVAYYSVAVFIAAVIAVPSRAMHQITHPITAGMMANNQHEELNVLYKQTSINLQFIGGLIFLGILVNIQQLYLLIPEKYSGGISVVFLIGFTKYFDLVLGNNNAIIFNSKYYRSVLFLGILLLIFSVLLNYIFIPKYGINGAAVATLVSIAGYSLAKLFFVVFKLKLFPFSIKNLWLLLVTVVLFFGFYYWDFSFQPMVNILLKSILVSSLYIFVNYKLKISEEINKEIGSLKRMITF